MHIVFNIIFLSLICAPLAAMKAPEKDSSSQLQELFATARKVHKAEKPIDELRWNPQGTLLAATTDAQHPFIFDPQDNSVFVIPVDQQEKDSSSWAGHLAWNKSGKRIAIGRKSQTIFIFDVAKKLITHSTPPENYSGPFAPTVAWSPTEENVLACCGHKGFVKKYLVPEDDAEPVVSLSTLFISKPEKWSTGLENFYGIGDGYGYPTRLAWAREVLAMAYRYGAFFTTQENTIGGISPWGDNKTISSRAIACHPQKNRIACVFALEKPRIVLGEPDGESLKIISTKDLDEKWTIFDISFSYDGRFLTVPYNKCILTMDGDTLEELHSHPMGKDADYCENAQWNPQRTQLAFADSGKLFMTQKMEDGSSEEK
jgi:WD40 repeat protein